MKLSKNLFVSSLGILITLPILPLVAQNPSIPPLKPNITPDTRNLGDIPDLPTQSRSWVCNKESDRIAVSAKEIQGWKTVIEKQGWQCSEGNTEIPDKTLSFSCEPEQTLGILSVYWLGGKNGKQQLTSWKENLSSQYNMICTLNNAQFFDTQTNFGVGE